jgi:uncharacterized protein (UPF0335 family)
MSTNESIKELLEEMLRIDNEISLLRDEKKDVFDRFKNEVDPRTFKAALQVAKIKTKVNHLDEFERILDVCDGSL